MNGIIRLDRLTIFIAESLAKRYLSGSAVPSIQNQVRAPVAIKAMAAKLARLVYRMLRYGMKYVDQGAAVYDAQRRHAQIKQLNWKAAKLGCQVVRLPAA
jgi:transposase